ncbi:MAG: hypothetical protein Q4P05_06240 [Actinomycetaceae bacterium]|nr:hypothetical protein [Actinomycetaceae bacterium]
MKDAIKRTRLPIALIVIGTVMAVVGIVFSTVARPSPEVTASLDEPQEPYVMTHEGVLDLFDSDAIITAEGDEETPIVMVVGHASDIAAWLDGAAYAEIVGLQSWTQLKAESQEATSDDNQPGSPENSDMWLEKKTGTGSVSLTQKHGAGDLSILVASDGEQPAPKVSITWERTVSTAWATALIIFGALLALLGFSLAWSFLRTKKKVDPERRKKELDAQRRVETPVKKTIEATAGGKTVKFPSRRAIREARERGENEIIIDGQRFDTGLVPVVKKVRTVEEDALPGDPSTDTDSHAVSEVRREEGESNE